MSYHSGAISRLSAVKFMVLLILAFFAATAQGEEKQIILSCTPPEPEVQTGSSIHFSVTGDPMDDYQVMVVTPESHQVFLEGAEADYTVNLPGFYAVIAYGHLTGHDEIYMSEMLYFTGTGGSSEAGHDEDWNGYWTGRINNKKLHLYISTCPFSQDYDICLKIENIYSYTFTAQSAGSDVLSFSLNGRSGRMLLDEEKHAISIPGIGKLNLPLIGKTDDEAGFTFINDHVIPRTAEIHYQKTSDIPDMIYSSDFSAEMFQQDTTVFHYDIAKLSVLMAATAYDVRLSERGDQIVATYHALGIPDEHIMLFNYMGHPLNNPDFREYDHEEFSIAARSMGDYMLLLICMRGSGEINKSDDWVTNGAAESDTDMNVWVHHGFHGYLKKAIKGLKAYMQRYPEIREAMAADKLKVLITGHSLGGGCANLLGAYLNSKDNKDPWAGMDDTFVYTYACPRVIHEKDNLHPTTTSCANIFNIVNGMDPVPQLPKDFWFAWRRFGTTYRYATSYKDDPIFDALEHFVHHEPLNYIQMVHFTNKEEKKQADRMHGVIVSSDP